MAEGAVCGFSHLPDRADDERQRNRRRVALLTDAAPNAKFLVPLDVTKDEDIRAVMAEAAKKFGKIDFLLHSIAYASLDDLKRDTVETSRDGFKLAMEISVYSLMAVANAARTILNDRGHDRDDDLFRRRKGGAGLQRDGHLQGGAGFVASSIWPSTSGPRGIRVNAVSAGPVRTLAGRGAGVDDMLPMYEKWPRWAATSRTKKSAGPARFCCRDMSDGITGEILHVDAGYNIMGSPGRLLDQYQAAAKSLTPSQARHCDAQADRHRRGRARGPILDRPAPAGVPLAGLVGISRRQGRGGRNARAGGRARMPRRDRPDGDGGRPYDRVSLPLRPRRRRAALLCLPAARWPIRHRPSDFVGCRPRNLGVTNFRQPMRSWLSGWRRQIRTGEATQRAQRTRNERGRRAKEEEWTTTKSVGRLWMRR